MFFGSGDESRRWRFGVGVFRGQPTTDEERTNHVPRRYPSLARSLRRSLRFLRFLRFLRTFFSPSAKIGPFSRSPNPQFPHGQVARVGCLAGRRPAAYPRFLNRPQVARPPFLGVLWHRRLAGVRKGRARNLRYQSTEGRSSGDEGAVCLRRRFVRNSRRGTHKPRSSPLPNSLPVIPPALSEAEGSGACLRQAGEGSLPCAGRLPLPVTRRAAKMRNALA